ncbi:MAG: S1/P1 nuclease [Haliscomenobacter sp.]|nr:S1/P1 nuclease [Haliscomenobacter sp.]
MKKLFLLTIILISSLRLQAWWDPGHMVTAMIAYANLSEPARKRVDELTKVLQRDYPYVNHFITTGPWPDDLKAEGVRAYDTWHYTNLPSNPDGVALPPQPEVDIIWAIGECQYIFRNNRPREIEKARFLAFLVHFVSDLHQPLHSTSVFTHEQPGGNRGGNGFALKDSTWNNLHALWDDGCGYLSAYNDIRPYGKPKNPLTEDQVGRIRILANQLMNEFPESSFPNASTLDPDFWALESHKLAMKHAYRGVKGKDNRGRDLYLMSGDELTATYLQQGQEVVRRQLALSGYRLARMLNELFGK